MAPVLIDGRVVFFPGTASWTVACRRPCARVRDLGRYLLPVAARGRAGTRWTVRAGAGWATPAGWPCQSRAPTAVPDADMAAVRAQPGPHGVIDRPERAPRVLRSGWPVGYVNCSARRMQPEPEVAGRGVDRLRHPGRRPVAAAVVRRAQVRAALHHPARDAGRVARVDAASSRRRRAGSGTCSRRVRSGRAPGTSRRSTPRRCRSCRTGRSRWPGSGRPARCRS